MYVDADSLEQLNLRTRDGAEQAGHVFTDRVGADTRIGATKITLESEDDLTAELEAGEETCVQFALAGPLSGTALLSFDERARERVREGVDDAATADRPLVGLGVELIGSFIAEWRDHVGGEIEVDQPTYVVDPAGHDFGLSTLGTDTESTPVFRSVIDADTGRITLYLAPDRDSIEALLGTDGTPEFGGTDDTAADAFGIDGVADGGTTTAAGEADTSPAASATEEETPDFGGESEETPDFGGEGEEEAPDFGGASEETPDFGGEGEEEAPDFGGEGDGESLFDDGAEATALPLEKLSVFTDLTREGTEAAAERVTAMTGIPTETEITGISFTPIDDISNHLDADRYVGTTTELDGRPSGHLIVLFGAESAVRVAEAMLPMEPDGEGLTPMHESAIEELANIVTSGFIDGWANVMQTSVDHTPPAFDEDMEMALLEIVTEQLGPFQTHAYTIESRIETDEGTFDCEIHALPDEAELGEALENLSVERRDQTSVDPDDLF